MKVPSEFKLTSKDAIHKSANSHVFRGTYEGKEAILKVFPFDYPPESVQLAYQKDHNVSSLLYEKYPNDFAQPLNFTNEPNNLYVAKSFEGFSLAQYLKENKKMNVEKFLNTAISVCYKLHLAHEQNVVHCDIKPQNILQSEEKQSTFIIDFESSFLVSLKNPKVPKTDRGTYLYMSPEQTGRTTSLVDKTSDIYSLGITFFQLLTGRVPFEGDLTNVVYSHIAKQPPTLKSFETSIPDCIEQVIQKMIKKNQNERYFSIIGVKKELEFIQQNLKNQDILKTFRAGQLDVDDIFRFDNKLYGRDKEVKLLKERLQFVEQNDSVEMCMICGSSGIGKSRLVDDILIKEKYRLVFTGKYDQFQKSRPYFAFIQIFKKLFGFLALKSKEELIEHKREILSVLTDRAKIITNFIPESIYVLGEDLPELLDLPSESDEQKRFISAIIDFLKIYASNGNVLALFLDDLQWADPPSLSLIEQLLSEKDVRLFILGAYRDNEVSESHPLMTILQPLLTEREFITVTLDHLDFQNIEEFLSDSLKSKDIKELSNVVFKKTNGNPFFMKEFTLALYDKNLIKFDYSTEKWNWDLKEISNTKFSDNVVDFMVGNLNEFTETTKIILNIAACIGNTFTIEVMCMVYDKSPQETYKDLLIPITLGWIYQKDSSYKFVHDRLQQAAYEIFKDKAQTHLKIGEKLLKTAMKQDDVETHIFDIVNNLNEASDIFHDRNHLISLNLMASKVATKNYAFEPALKFSSTARSLLTENAWELIHDLTYRVNFMQATNLFLSCKLEEAIEVFQELVEKSTTNFESLKAIVAYTKLLLFIANFPVAIKLIFDVFEMYEVSKDMPKEKNEDFENWSFKLLHELINFTKGKETGKLFLDGIPKKADEEMSLLSRYMLQSSAVFYQTAQPHFAFANQLMGVKIAVNYGNNDCLPAILASLSWHAQFYFKENEAKIFGKLAQELTKNINSPNIHLYVKFYSGLLQIFNSNATNAIKLTENAYTFGFNIGELNWGSYACFCWMNFNICNGTNFLILLGRVLAAQKAIYNSKHLVIGDMMAASIETIKIITGKSTSFNSVHMIPGYIEIPFGRFNYYEQKATSLFLLQDFKGARIALDTIQQFPTENIGLPHFYEIAMTSILIDYHLYQQSLDNTILENMKANIDLLEGYSKLNAIYFQSRYSLGQALFKSLMIDKTKIEDIVEIFSLFNSASTHAGSNGCSWIEAMAIEYFAEFCEETSQFKEYSRFLYSLAYHKWKAMGVIVRCIKLKQYEAISSTTNPSIDLNTGSASATESLNMLGVDLQTVIKSSNTVSEDLEKKKLLTKLNQVIVENAGATRGFIILKENEKYIVSSEFSSSETQSQISKEILKSSKFLSLRVFNQCLNQKNMIFYHNAMKEENLKEDEYIQNNFVKSVLCAPIAKGKNITGVLYLENNNMEGAFTESKKFILRHVLSQVAISIENSNLFEDVKTINEAYARFLPKEFLNLLEKQDVRNVKQSDSVEKKMTILFSDIRNFTSITDKMDAKESFQFVNDILSEIAPAISKNHGFVDKFIGDCVMAIFPGSPKDGVKAGVEMLDSLKKLNKSLQIPIDIGVGLAYGNVMLGTLGFEKRLDATVISSTVNTASRMESLTKTLGVSLVVTKEVQETIKLVPELISYSLGYFYLKGQENAKELFEIVSSQKKGVINIEEFEKGKKLFQQKKFKKAMEVFNSLENYGISTYYSRVCELYRLNELPSDWNGEIKISKDGEPLQIVSDLEKMSVDKIEFIQQALNDPNQLDYIFEYVKNLKK